MAKRVLVSAACTAISLGAAIKALMPEVEVETNHVGHLLSANTAEEVEALAAGYDHWIYLDLPEAAQRAKAVGNGIAIPEFAFNAFQPDEVTVHDGAKYFMGPMESLHSAIGVWAYKKGLNSREAARLFRPDVFEALGYLDGWDSSCQALAGRCVGTGIDYERLMRRIKRQMPFTWTVQHPRIPVVAEMARQLVEKLGYQGDAALDPIEDFVFDRLRLLIWPIYPGVAERYGLRGSLRWRHRNDEFHDVQAFLDACFATYPDKDTMICERLKDGAYDSILEQRL